MNLVAVENFCATSVKAAPDAAAIWLEKSLEKKFQSPLVSFTLNIATRLDKSMPSLKNFNPSPGASG